MLAQELMNEVTTNTVGTILVSAITIIPATLAAVWSRDNKKTNKATLHEVQANGGMTDPDPTLKDYIKFVGENTIIMSKRLERFEDDIREELSEMKARLKSIDDQQSA